MNLHPPPQCFPLNSIGTGKGAELSALGAWPAPQLPSPLGGKGVGRGLEAKGAGREEGAWF